MEPADVRVGLLAYGAIGHEHNLAVQATPGLTLTAVCDTNPERVAAALELAPEAVPFADATRMLDSGLVDLVALVRLTALSIAYVPGRVLGMTPQVEELTLGVRREVVPWVGVALWVLVIVAGVRSGSALRRGPRRAGT